MTVLQRLSSAGVLSKRNTDARGRNLTISEAALQYILRLLALTECADTAVGSGMIRGISGGQRKRVTSGEMVVGCVAVGSIRVALQMVRSKQGIHHQASITILDAQSVDFGAE